MYSDNYCDRCRYHDLECKIASEALMWDADTCEDPAPDHVQIEKERRARMREKMKKHE